MKIPGKLPIKTIVKKLPKLTDEESESVNSSIRVSPQSVVSLDLRSIVYKKSKKSFSVKFANYVEPYMVGGQKYTMFYTEVDHNLKVGDRVFIVGGNYDSDLLIQENIYSENSDGYKVQYVDRTKVVLNIDYTAVDPWISDPMDDFIKVYVASTQEEFDYFCHNTSNRGDYPYTTNRFSSFGTYSNNSFLYVSGTVSVSASMFGIYGFSYSSSNFLTYSNAILLLAGSVSGYFFDITSDVMSGSYSSYLSESLTTNNRIMPINGSFTVGDTPFKRGYTYYYDIEDESWKVDRAYLPAFVTEQNFRNGRFNKGEFNQGLYGTSIDEIDWNGPLVKFNLGTLLNVNWLDGDIGRGNGNSLSYFTTYDDFGNPLIKSNSNNNAGFGYNYAYDTRFHSVSVGNGNFYNVIAGSYSSLNSVANLVGSVSTTYSVYLNGGVYNDSDILFGKVSNSVLSSSLIFNSEIYKSKSINSEFQKSAFLNSKFTSDKIVKIENYAEFKETWYVGTTMSTYRVYKFYVNQSNFDRLREFQSFYFQGLSIVYPVQDPLNFFDDKFTIDAYHLSYDTNTGKNTRKVICQLSTTEDNRNIPRNSTNILSENSLYGMPSIDIMVCEGDNYSGMAYTTFNISSLFSVPWPNFSSTIVKLYQKDGTIYTTNLGGFSDELDVLDWLISTDTGDWRWEAPIQSFVVDSETIFDRLEFLVFFISVSAVGIRSRYPKLITSEGYVLDSDYKSGLFKNSEWITGNYANYNKDNSIYTDPDGYYTASSIFNYSDPAILQVSIKDRNRSSLFSEGDVVFINGLHFDTQKFIGPTTSSSLVPLPITYRVYGYTYSSAPDRYLLLEDFIAGTSSILYSVPGFTASNYLFTKNAENNYNYVHPLKFENSKIYSGIFRRAYFESCIFDNKTFDSTQRDFSTFENLRKLAVSDALLSDNSNIINSGMFQYSSRVAGSDVWNNGIFLNSIWSSNAFTYSRSATGSEVRSLSTGEFINGVFKQSRWVDGIFTNGIFYKNSSNSVGTQSVYDDSLNVYYRKNFESRYSWINGIFKNGGFELSNWENGEFRNGDFYNSNFLSGNAFGGIFGKRNIPSFLTLIMSGSFSNLNVLNANFVAQNPFGDIDGTYSIDWYSGVFNNGVFGVKMDAASYSLVGINYPFRNTWMDGSFNSGNFTDTASWKNGKFNGGKFTSYYGYPYVLAASYSTATSSYFAWQGGEFNGGEFGNGGMTANSTWYNGEFNGGIFRGRYWHNGIFTRGYFLGSGTSSTVLSNIPIYLSGFSNEFYGLWNSGYVSEIKDVLVKDKKNYTKLEREFSKKAKRSNVEFSGVLWRGGTFSHNDSVMSNSVWLDGAFQNGLFLNSSFNPYVNYLANGNFSTALTEWSFDFSDDYGVGGHFTNPLDTLIFNGTSSISVAYQSTGLVVGEVYTLTVQVNEVVNTEIRFGDFIDPINSNFTSTNGWDLFTFSAMTFSSTELIIATGFPGHLHYEDSDGQSVNAYSLAIVPGILEPGRTYDVSLYAYNNTNCSIEVGSTNYMIVNGIIGSSSNETYSYPYFATNGYHTATITALHPDFTLKISSAGVVGPWEVDVVNVIVTPNTVLTNADSSVPVIYSVTFSAHSSDFGLEFIGLADQSSTTGAFWNISSTASIFSIELTRGISGFNLSDTCVWENGKFKDSDFFVSKWNNGRFISGWAYGMIWKNGIADYMNAYNVFWEDGIWRNGNWNGSPFTYENISLSQSTVAPGFASDILTNVALYRQSIGEEEYQSIHINNAFTYSLIDDSLLDDPELDGGFVSVFQQATSSTTKQWYADTAYTGYTGYSKGSCGIYFISPLSYLNGSVRTSVSGELNFDSNKNSPRLYVTSSTYGHEIFQNQAEYDIEVEYMMQYSDSSKGSINPIVKTASFEIAVGSEASNSDDWGGFKNTIIETISVRSASSFAPAGCSPPWFGSTGTKTLNYTYKPDFSIDGATEFGRSLYIRQLSGVNSAATNVTLYIFKILVSEKIATYDSQYNNTTYSIFGTTPSYYDSLTLPSVAYIGGASTYGEKIAIRFGNGIFRAGIWENGVWNDGWRYDTEVIYFGDLKFFQQGNQNLKSVAFQGKADGGNVSFAQTSWIFTLMLADGQDDIILSDLLSVGGKVSVGNIVSVDINNNRRLIRDYLTIVDVGSDTISLQFTTNFPTRSIERDSENHPIYLTRNVWLNGAFLNGLFRGVWSNGLFKGFPFITKMIESQWVDGRFDGGHFQGSTFSLGESIYNSSLIQNFLFKDNNIAQPLEFSYNSWIDVSHYTQSMSNIYRDNISYDSGFNTNRSIMNLNGFPTVDVLSSVSYFRDGFSSGGKYYNLGYKYRKYVDYIEDPYFRYPVSSTQSLTTLGVSDYDNIYDDYDLSLTHSVPGMYTFVNSGWRPLPLNLSLPAEYSANTINGSDINNIDRLLVVGTFSTGANLLENLNTIDSIPRGRYIAIEFAMDYESDRDLKFPYLLNEPAPYSISPTFIGHNQTGEDVKIEYFYNKPSLQMILAATIEYFDVYYDTSIPGFGITFSTPHGLQAGDVIYISKRDKTINLQVEGTHSVFSVTNPYHVRIPSVGVGYVSTPLGTDGGVLFVYRPYTAYFDYIKLYEIDMIPFFLYATESRINKSIQAPWQATAPLIDYSDANFSLVDNIVLSESLFTTVQSETVLTANGVTTNLGGGSIQNER